MFASLPCMPVFLSLKGRFTRLNMLYDNAELEPVVQALHACVFLGCIPFETFQEEEYLE